HESGDRVVLDDHELARATLEHARDAVPAAAGEDAAVAAPETGREASQENSHERGHQPPSPGRHDAGRAVDAGDALSSRAARSSERPAPAPASASRGRRTPR